LLGTAQGGRWGRQKLDCYLQLATEVLWMSRISWMKVQRGKEKISAKK
jgi:hypothetical protein